MTEDRGGCHYPRSCRREAYDRDGEECRAHQAEARFFERGGFTGPMR